MFGHRRKRNRHASIATSTEVSPAPEPKPLRTTPNERVMIKEQLIARCEIDLGDFTKCEQIRMMLPGDGAEPTTRSVVTLYDGSRATLDGGSYCGGKHGGNGTYFTKRLGEADSYTNERGPTLALRDNRLIEIINYGHGPGFCEQVDRLRATLDDNTGETIIG